MMISPLNPPGPPSTPVPFTYTHIPIPNTMNKVIKTVRQLLKVKNPPCLCCEETVYWGLIHTRCQLSHRGITTAPTQTRAAQGPPHSH